MTPHEFVGYGTGSPNTTIIVERITHWWPINFNGKPGTEIALDTGTSIRVGHYASDVERVVKAAQRT
jgi:hypothetical protein